MRVADVYKRFSRGADTVSPDTPIEKVIELFMKNRERRNVYVVDASRRLMGMITTNEIFRSVKTDIEPNRIIFFMKKNTLRTAKDVMIEPEIVTLDCGLDDALRTARVFKLQDIPVCRGDRLVGELDAFELVHGLMKSGR